VLPPRSHHLRPRTSTLCWCEPPRSRRSRVACLRWRCALRVCAGCVWVARVGWSSTWRALSVKLAERRPAERSIVDKLHVFMNHLHFSN
jgi:hypothetical protein